MPKGQRLTVWIPEDAKAVFHRIVEIQRAAESQGIKLAQADVVRWALIKGLTEQHPIEDALNGESSVDSRDVFGSD